MGNVNNSRGPNRARTKAAVRSAIADVKGAAGIRNSPPPRPRMFREGINWLIALGAGATVAWKSWKVATSPAPEGHENATAKRFNAMLEREARQPATVGSARPKASARRVSKTETQQAEIAAALESARRNQAAADTTAQGRGATQRGLGGAKTGEHTARSGDDTDSPPQSSALKIESGALALGKEFYKRFSEDEVTTRAAALAFVGVFSLVPLLLFAVVALGFIFRDPAEATKHVQAFVAQMLPGESASKAANDVLAQTHLVETAQDMSRHAGWPLVIGIGSLLWAGTSLFVTAATPMNAAWDVTETRNFLKLRLTAIGVLFGAGLIFVLSIGASALPRVIADMSPPLFGAQGLALALLSAVSILIAVVLDMMMFVLIYRFLPNAPVTWKAALFSGALTGLAWELFKQGFGMYLAHFGDSNNKMYGALGGVVLLITWIYYSCTVLLSGAEIGKMYHEHKEEGGIAKRPPQTPSK